MAQHGQIIKWDSQKGFGFIRPDDGTADVFAHIKAFDLPPYTGPAQGMRVKYAVKIDAHNRVAAAKVRIEGSSFLGRGTVRRMGQFLPLLTAAGVIAFLQISGKISLALCGAAAVINALTYALYAQDKSSARQRRWRTPEATLHLMSLLGGWPTAFLAQRQLRHKNRKSNFQIIYVASALLNIAGLYWYLQR